MKKTIIVAISFLLMFSSLAQNRIILNNNGYIVIDNSAKIVLENSNTNAITVQGTGGNIVSENQEDEVIWLIGNASGLYSIPWTTTPVSQGGNGTKIPMTMNISAAGNNAGRFNFSTYETTTDSNAPYPSGVTTMNSGSSDGSLFTVDRFWKLDNSSYTTKPAAVLSFVYDDNTNEIGGSNSIVESSLVAQRWNSTISSWEGLTFGSTNAATNTTNGVVVTGANFFPIWTLVNGLTPLPVELIEQWVKATECRQVILWTVASETNASHYRIEVSIDAENWTSLGTVPAQGTTQNQMTYSYEDFTHRTDSYWYYKIVQVDHNGQVRDFQPMVAKNDCLNTSLISVYPNPFFDQVSVFSPSKATITIEDMNGKLVIETTLSEGTSNLNLAQLAPGVYTLCVINDKNQKVQKLLKL